MTENTIKDKTPHNRRYILDELRERKERENVNKQKCVTTEEVIEALSVAPELSTEMVLKNYNEMRYGINQDMTENEITENEEERLDNCYECRGYGDDYSYDEETEELICNCESCPFNGLR